MFNKFLCGPHRKALNANPEKAIRLCSMALETGQNLTCFGNKREALAHLGCAFEASEIVLSHYDSLTIDPIGMFSEASSALIHCLIDLGYDAQSQAVLRLSINRLYQYADVFPEQRNLVQTLVVTLRDFTIDGSHLNAAKPTHSPPNIGVSRQAVDHASLILSSSYRSSTVH